MLTLGFFRAFLLILTCSVTFSALAAAPVHVTLYQPENLDARGRQIPETPQLLQFLNYFERAAGLKFNLVILPWKRAQLEVLQGKGILYGFSKSAERLEQFRFSKPVITFHVWAISYGRSDAPYAKLSDLQGKIVTGGLGLSHGEEYEKAKNKVFIVQEDFASYRERFKKLLSKRSDLMFIPFDQNNSREQVEKFVNLTVVPEFNDPDLNGQAFEISLNPMFNDTIHFASAKAHFDEVMNKIDMAIQKGTKNRSVPNYIDRPNLSDSKQRRR